MITAESFVPGMQIGLQVAGKAITVVIIATAPLNGVQYVIAGAGGVLVLDAEPLAKMLNAHEGVVIG